VREGQPERLAAMGFDRDQLAENLLTAVFEQIFRWRVFHADTHPGNLIALAGNAVGFVDFGLVDRLDPAVHAGLSRYLTALFKGDAERIEQGPREVLVTTDESDPDGFSDAIRAAVRQWRGTDAAPEPGQRSPLATLMIKALDAARRHRFGVPPSALAMYRSLLTAEMVARQLAPDADLRGVARRFLADLALSEALEALYPDQVKAALIDLAALVRDLPGDLQQIVSALAEGRLPVKLQTSESRQDRRLGAIKARLLTIAIVSVGVAVLLVGLGDTPLPGGLTLAPLLWTVMAALYVGIFILWRHLP
jgi:ubiquinone biosynthesis protein